MAGFTDAIFSCTLCHNKIGAIFKDAGRLLALFTPNIGELKSRVGEWGSVREGVETLAGIRRIKRRKCSLLVLVITDIHDFEMRYKRYQDIAFAFGFCT